MYVNFMSILLRILTSEVLLVEFKNFDVLVKM